MSIQQLLAQLASMGGPGSAFEGLTAGGMSSLTSEQIQEAIGSMYPTNVANLLQPQMFQTISPNLVKSASIGAYSPLFQQKQGSLQGQLMQSLGGQQMRKAYGGFAGSGGSQYAEGIAKDVYGKGMQDVLTQSLASRTQSLSTLQDIINQWQQTAQSFVGQST